MKTEFQIGFPYLEGKIGKNNQSYGLWPARFPGCSVENLKLSVITASSSISLNCSACFLLLNNLFSVLVNSEAFPSKRL